MEKEKEKPKKKKRPWVTPTITAIVYNPEDKIMAYGCDTGSGAGEIGMCALGPCMPCDAGGGYIG